MNEELRIIISAQVDKLKAGCKEAVRAIDGIDKEGKETSDNSEKHFTKIGDAAKKAGKVISAGLAAGFAAATAGVVKITKDAVEAYSEYEQLTGGVETLFKDSSDKVMKYASEAYKTVGMNANEYMGMATELSASMIQSLGGDVNAAAESIDVAMRDIADNAAKMGTPIQSIQDAYKGFAKQNYTMLDNLKLGYGGTKTEMERLLADAEKLSGIKYDINNLSDVSAAIHVIQEEMGITGTVSAEAASTIQGSAAMMKSSWQNLLVGLADENANFDELLTNFIDSAVTFEKNLIPRIQVALGGIVKLIQGLAPEIINILPTLVNQIIPQAVQAVSSIITAITEALPGIIEAIVNVLPDIIDAIMSAIPQITEALLNSLPVILEALIEIVSQIIVALGEMLPTIVEQIVSIIPTLIQTLLENIPLLLEAAIQLLMAIVNAIPEIIPPLIQALPELIESLMNALLEALPLLLDAAVQLFNAIVEAIPIIIPVILTELPGIITNIIAALIKAIPLLLKGAIQLLMAIVLAVPKIIPDLIAALPLIVSTVITNLADKLKEVFSNIWNTITASFKNVKGWFGDKFKDAAQAIFNVIRPVVNFFKGVWDSIKSIFNKVGEVVGNAITNTVKKAINGVLSTAIKIINGFIDAINVAIGVINTIPGVSINKLSKLEVPQLAKGGIIDSATLAVVGERGKEAVMPLENNLEWLDKLAGMLSERMGSSAPIVMQVDGKTFGEISVNSINQLTKQTGSLQLKLV